MELGLTAVSSSSFNRIWQARHSVRADGHRSRRAEDYPPYRKAPTIRLTSALKGGTLGGFFRTMKVCDITGSRAARGSVIHRRGLAKKKGGVGRHITKMVPRIFAPNLQRQRIWVPELKKFVRVRATARGLKTINKHGAYKALKKAGAI